MLTINPMYILCIIAITNPNNSFPHRISRWRKNWILPGAAGGWGAVKSVANAVRKQMDIRQDVIAMFDMNKPEGFDCPGCAWPDPKHSASFDICENGAKAIAWEVTDKQVNASFFAENTVQSLLTWEITSLRLRDVSLSLWNMMTSATVTSH